MSALIPCALKVSVGIEDISDIVADFSHAFAAALPEPEQ